MTLLGLLACGLASVSLAACGSTTASIPVKTSPNAPVKPAPKLLLQQALADAGASSSVHETETARHDQSTIRFNDDVGTSSGRQQIHISNGEVAHVLVVGKTAYFSGNLKALTNYFGFPVASAHNIGTRWVVVPESSPAHSTVAADATLRSALTILKLTGHLTEIAPTVIRGQHVIGIVGTAPAQGAAAGKVRGTVYITQTADPLPVEVKLVDGKTSITAYFDRWGERLSLKAPANTWSSSAGVIG